MSGLTAAQGEGARGGGGGRGGVEGESYLFALPAKLGTKLPQFFALVGRQLVRMSRWVVPCRYVATHLFLPKVCLAAMLCRNVYAIIGHMHGMHVHGYSMLQAMHNQCAATGT